MDASSSSSPPQEYAEIAILPTLLPLLVKLCRERPDAPVEWLGAELHRANPNSAALEHPDESYMHGALLGDGLWAQVYRATRKRDGKAVALKLLRVKEADAAELL